MTEQVNFPIKLAEKDTFDGLVAGNYCFVTMQDGKKKVILSCPVDGTIAYLSHDVKSEDPLTLYPSVQMPQDVIGQEILLPCGHHFWVINGYATIKPPKEPTP